MFAAAEHRQAEEQRSSVEREVVVKKVIHNVNVSDTSSSAAADRYASQYGVTSTSREARAGSTAIDAAASSSSHALRSAIGSTSGYRAGSVAYSRAGSMARSSLARATSAGRSTSVIRY